MNLPYRIYGIYCIRMDLSNRFYRESVNQLSITVPNSKGHLSISAGACSEHLEMAEKNLRGNVWSFRMKERPVWLFKSGKWSDPQKAMVCNLKVTNGLNMFYFSLN